MNNDLSTYFLTFLGGGVFQFILAYGLFTLHKLSVKKHLEDHGLNTTPDSDDM